MQKTNKPDILTMIQCSLFAALMCVLSPVTIPIGVVPVSMGVFAVMLSAIVLGPKRSIVSLLVYLLIGIFGLPVFAGGQTGLAALTGPTGGYIWSYFFVCTVTGTISRINTKMMYTFFACVVAMALCYVCGTAQYIFVTGADFSTALAVCVYPFVVFDIIKSALASALGTALRKRLAKHGFEL